MFKFIFKPRNRNLELTYKELADRLFIAEAAVYERSLLVAEYEQIYKAHDKLWELALEIKDEIEKKDKYLGMVGLDYLVKVCKRRMELCKPLMEELPFSKLNEIDERIHNNELLQIKAYGKGEV
jgi:hypothetical protein